MKHPGTEILYKYMSARRAIRVIRTNKIYYPRPCRFNDPFDCNIQFDDAVSPEEYRKGTFRLLREDGCSDKAIEQRLAPCFLSDGSLNQDILDKIKEVAECFRASNADLGVLSLTEDPVSILMWAHYADNHKGICIGFERKDDNALGDDEITTKVKYSDTYPQASMADVSFGNAALSRKVLLTKAIDWAYENEWRLMRDQGDREEDIPGEIIEVILGTNAKFTCCLKKACVKRKIKVFQCNPSAGKFVLELKELL